MAKAGIGNYLSQGFEDRIEVNLANISRSPEDKFALVGVQYVPPTFKCELCGHEPCLYAYSVKNLETGIIIKVGSECIHHFKAKGCNIDLASGLVKRVKSIVRKMRRYMKGSLENEEYKTMPKEQKRILITRLFMKHQAMEALKPEGTKKALLLKDDVLKIIQENPYVEVEATPEEEAKEEKKEKKAARKATKKTNVQSNPAPVQAAVAAASA